MINTEIHADDVNASVDLNFGLSQSQGYDDNIFSTKEHKTDSGFTITSPYIEAVYQREGLDSFFRYGADIGLFASSSDDNYIDQRLLIGSTARLSQKMGIDIEVGLSKLHEERGSIDSSEAISRPDKYDRFLASTSLEYGLANLKADSGRIVFFGDYSAKNYVNNLEQTRRKDLDQYTVGSTFFYKAFSATELILELSSSKYDYALDDAAQDNDSVFYLIGVTWAKSAKTVGSVKLGIEDKTFSAFDTQSTAWDVNLSWLPRSYSTLTIRSESKIGESSKTEDYSEDTSLSVSWLHEWKSRFSTELVLSYGRERLIEDDVKIGLRTTSSASIGLIYVFNNWLEMSLGAEHSGLDYSSLSPESIGLLDDEFDRTKYTLSLHGNL
jgi:hypothetical protein